MNLTELVMVVCFHGKEGEGRCGDRWSLHGAFEISFGSNDFTKLGSHYCRIQTVLKYRERTSLRLRELTPKARVGVTQPQCLSSYDVYGMLS